VGGGGDQAAGAVGTGAVAKGVISVSLGTSGVVFTAIDAPKFDSGGAAHTFCHANGAWHAMGVMLSCGGALRWYRDTLCMGMTYDAIAAEAEKVVPGCDGLTFLPYLTGERCPHNDPLARAAFAGMTLAHSHAHLSRAVFEGVSFGLLEGMDLLRGLGATTDEIRVTGGGARSGFWLQLLADLFGKACVTLECDEGPAYGAAILAGVGAGIWPDVVSACDQTVRVKSRIEPTGADYTHFYHRYQKLYAQTRGWNGV
jgi:xylulokinase